MPFPAGDPAVGGTAPFFINMFQKNTMPIRETGSSEAETVIAAGVKVEGDFTSQGNVLIEGVVEGSLKTERNLRVGEKASINADVNASNAVIAGEVHGNMVVAERLELEPTARISGDIKTKTLVVASGAEINGRITMGAEGGAKNGAVQQDRLKKAAAKIVESAVQSQSVEKEKDSAGSFFG